MATVKHAHHDFDIDIPDTDSYRHRKAGAQEVIVVSSQRWAVIHELEDKPEPRLEELLTNISDVDLVLVEGYKIEGHPKIQVMRTAAPKTLQPMPENIPGIIAIAGDRPEEIDTFGRDCPILDLNDTSQIAEHISQYLADSHN